MFIWQPLGGFKVAVWHTTLMNDHVNLHFSSTWDERVCFLILNVVFIGKL